MMCSIICIFSHCYYDYAFFPTISVFIISVANMISRRHAQLVCSDYGEVTLIDLKSTNGVYCNQRRIESCILKEGDLVRFGGRGSSIKLGGYDEQRDSEFQYIFHSAATSSASSTHTNNNDTDTSSTSWFDRLKSWTDNIQVVGTWLTSLMILANYLFSDPTCPAASSPSSNHDSHDLTFMQEYIVPLYAMLGISLNRVTFVIGFVFIITLSVLLTLSMVKRSTASPPTSIHAKTHPS